MTKSCANDTHRVPSARLDRAEFGSPPGVNDNRSILLIASSSSTWQEHLLHRQSECVSDDRACTQTGDRRSAVEFRPSEVRADAGRTETAEELGAMGSDLDRIEVDQAPYSSFRVWCKHD